MTARPPLAVTAYVGTLLDGGAKLAGLHDAIDRMALISALMSARGCISKAAKALGWHRNTMARNCTRLGVEPRDYKGPQLPHKFAAQAVRLDVAVAAVRANHG